MYETKITQADLKIELIGQPQVDAQLVTQDEIRFIGNDDGIVFPLHKSHLDSYAKRGEALPFMEIAGPRESIFFDPGKTKVGIVTCGGLCPGLNSIIRAVVMTAANFYGVKDIFGFRYGYQGLNPQENEPPIMLDPDMVDTIHASGGTILGSSRGPQSSKVMVDYLQSLGVSILFVVGGDGTMRGAMDLSTEIKARGAKISIVGIPKTIDNDVALIERSFGFETAVERATDAIYSAHAESKGTPNGIGLVKLMGRESGFIACNATLSSQVVNYCLIPEVPFALAGENGLLKVLERRLKARGHAVIVVAEGAGQNLLGTVATGTDKSGNKKLQDIGLFLKQNIVDYFKQIAMETSVKYIDPSYMIRSVAPTADDNVFCLMLGQNAVHAGMSGRTEVVIGYRNEHFVHLPMRIITSNRKHLRPEGRIWKTVLDTTRQPAEML